MKQSVKQLKSTAFGFYKWLMPSILLMCMALVMKQAVNAY